MAVLPVVKGLRLRATRVDACGMPIVGPRSRLITSGFITANLDPQMRDAEELEQTNAEGRVCVSDRTPPERKWYNASIELCAVNTCLISMFTDWEVVTDWEGNDIGFSDQKSVPFDRGVAIEIWSGVGSEDACEVPTTDDILNGSVGGSSLPYGYTLFVVKEGQLGGIEIGAKVSTFTISAITVNPTRWGRGPYNVMATDANNTPGRMLKPMQKEQHVRMFKTTIAPPEASDDCCPLILPSPYYGETAEPIAPAQPACGAEGTSEVQTITIGGSPTGGTFTMSFRGSTTAPIAHNASAATVQAALQSLPTIGTGNVTVTGSAGGPYTCTFTGDLAELNLPPMTASATGLTPSGTVTIATTQEGGQYS